MLDLDPGKGIRIRNTDLKGKKSFDSTELNKQEVSVLNFSADWSQVSSHRPTETSLGDSNSSKLLMSKNMKISPREAFSPPQRRNRS
jgi:hypothetical protein